MSERITLPSCPLINYPAWLFGGAALLRGSAGRTLSHSMGRGTRGQLFAPSSVTTAWPSTIMASRTSWPSVGVEGNTRERPSGSVAEAVPAGLQAPVVARGDGGLGCEGVWGEGVWAEWVWAVSGSGMCVGLG